MSDEPPGWKDLTTATRKAILMMRYIAGQSQVCPVCFCDAVIEALDEIKQGLDHDEMLVPMTVEELYEASERIHVDLAMGAAKGSA